MSSGIIRGEPNDEKVWAALDMIMDREYHFASGLGLKVARCFVDSGYATKTVYNYCRTRQSKGRFAIKGSGAMGIPLLYKYAYPKRQGVILTILGVNDGKQEVMSRLGIDTPGKMYFHFPHDDEFLKRGYDSVYFKQLISEHKVIRKSGGLVHVTWEPIVDKARNESLDLRCYILAAMKSCIGNIEPEKFWQRQFDAIKKTSTPSKKKFVIKEKLPASREMNIW